MNTPDYIPILSHSNHIDPSKGACFMEMISFLAGEEHSDRPRCVDPVLTSFGISVNDFVSDDNRNRLALLIPDFMGTAEDFDMATLHKRVQQEVLPDFYNWYIDKKTFQYHATNMFYIGYVLEQITITYQRSETRYENVVYDDAALEYAEKVAAIIRDMKEPAPVDISKAKEHPSVKVNA